MSPAADSAGRARITLPRPHPIVAASGLLALVPVVRMAAWVVGGSRVQYADYWLIFDQTWGPSGRPTVGRLIELYNGHLMAVPKVLYWLNVEVFGGSNVTLGFVVIAMALAIVGILVALAPRHGVHPAVTGAVVVATAALVFTPRGAWSYLLSMSGAAWLPANLLAVVALALDGPRLRRAAASTAAGLLAVLSYGTGLMVLPAVVVAGLARDGRPRRHHAPPAAAGIAALVWYQVARPDRGVPRPGPIDVLKGTMTLIGRTVVDDPGRARLLGFALVAAVLVLGVLAVRTGARHVAPWIGVGVYGLAASAMIAYGRLGFSDLVESRYVCIGGLVWIAAVGLAATVVGRGRPWVAVPLVLLALVMALDGGSVVDRVRERDLAQEELANAQAAGVSEGGTRWIGLGVPMPEIEDRLRRAGHHPYDGRWSNGCGVERVADSDLRPVEGSDLRAHASVPETSDLPDGVLMTGFIDAGDRDVTCLVAVDADGEVVGAGTYGWPRLTLEGGEAANGIRVVAPRGTSPLRVVFRVAGSDDRYVLAVRGT